MLLDKKIATFATLMLVSTGTLTIVGIGTIPGTCVATMQAQAPQKPKEEAKPAEIHHDEKKLENNIQLLEKSRDDVRKQIESREKRIRENLAVINKSIDTKLRQRLLEEVEMAYEQNQPWKEQLTLIDDKLSTNRSELVMLRAVRKSLEPLHAEIRELRKEVKELRDRKN